MEQGPVQGRDPDPCLCPRPVWTFLPGAILSILVTVRSGKFYILTSVCSRRAHTNTLQMTTLKIYLSIHRKYFLEMSHFTRILFSACSLLIARGQPMMTGDDKFLCHGEQYKIFPASALKNTTELIECPSQFFGEFPTGTFKHKPHLLSIGISNGSLETIGKDTFEGAKSLQYFNASRCALQGVISKETFCMHTPDMRLIDLSHNPKLIFTSKPFECLENLQCLDITGTIQNCSDAETVEWLHLQPEGRVRWNVCPSPEIRHSTCPSTQGTAASLFMSRLLNGVASSSSVTKTLISTIWVFREYKSTKKSHANYTVTKREHFAKCWGEE